MLQLGVGFYRFILLEIFFFSVSCQIEHFFTHCSSKSLSAVSSSASGTKGQGSDFPANPPAPEAPFIFFMWSVFPAPFRRAHLMARCSDSPWLFQAGSSTELSLYLLISPAVAASALKWHCLGFHCVNVEAFSQLLWSLQGVAWSCLHVGLLCLMSSSSLFPVEEELPVESWTSVYCAIRYCIPCSSCR